MDEDALGPHRLHVRRLPATLLVLAAQLAADAERQPRGHSCRVGALRTVPVALGHIDHRPLQAVDVEALVAAVTQHGVDLILVAAADLAQLLRARRHRIVAAIVVLHRLAGGVVLVLERGLWGEPLAA